MKIKLSKSQWELIGNKTGWTRTSQDIGRENIDISTNITDQISKEQKEKIVKDVTQNLPEYSLNLQCIGWNYNESKFTFMDDETGKRHIIELPELLRGYDILGRKVKNKSLFFYGLDIKEPETWDADVVDALVQCSIFGDVIYG